MWVTILFKLFYLTLFDIHFISIQFLLFLLFYLFYTYSNFYLFYSHFKSLIKIIYELLKNYILQFLCKFFTSISFANCSKKVSDVDIYL